MEVSHRVLMLDVVSQRLVRMSQIQQKQQQQQQPEKQLDKWSAKFCVHQMAVFCWLLAIVILIGASNCTADASIKSNKQQGANSKPGEASAELAASQMSKFALRFGAANQSASDAAATDWLMMGANDDLYNEEARRSASFADSNGNNTFGSTTKSRGSNRSNEFRRRKATSSSAKGRNNNNNNTAVFDDEQSDSSEPNEILDDAEDSQLAGTQKEPECAGHGRYYCTYKEDYPLKLVTEVTKYYKWPLEKLFRDLHGQIMPKLAQDSNGNLVCDSVTRVVRPGWARNTNDRWLVVINTDNYHQYVTEVVCQYGSNSRCNFIPPCYYSSCQQRYNTQKLLVIDPTNPYRGPFLSEFLFPSCCVCYVPTTSESLHDKYRPSPKTMYQRTMQQEAATNLNPSQYRPGAVLEELQASLVEASATKLTSPGSPPGQLQQQQQQQQQPQQQQQLQEQRQSLALAPGEIRRSGDLTDFPRLG